MPKADGRELLAIARHAIEHALARREYRPPRLHEPWSASRGVFVTLRAEGELRGCIGHLQPTEPTLSEEVARVAVSSAFEDPRFPPLAAHELPGVDLEISLLQPAEPVSDLAELDPRRYGVIVSCGWRRGVLLPDLDGVDDVETQVGIAMKKGGIRRDEPWRVERFEVVKLAERG